MAATENVAAAKRLRAIGNFVDWAVTVIRRKIASGVGDLDFMTA
jgi:hypothetical protein